MGMKSEIEEALQAHYAWREHFKDILYGRAPFELKSIAAPDQCVLGKWLVNEGQRMIPTELHDDICAVHAEFHHIAADIIQKIKDKRYVEAKKDIELDGALNQTSLRLRGMLVKLSFTEPAKAGMPDAGSEQPSGDQEILEPLVPPCCRSEKS
jgi:hypothetical protein